ncbi:hypothetical protein Scep_021480 [Stephania cephalantha]|uniref:Uncharacterized protein n=1 Tax=Stephania cephalantha TaxID=152367 RepID=A0AAP0F4N5_9MAGN
MQTTPEADTASECEGYGDRGDARLAVCGWLLRSARVELEIDHRRPTRRERGSARWRAASERRRERVTADGTGEAVRPPPVWPSERRQRECVVATDERETTRERRRGRSEMVGGGERETAIARGRGTSGSVAIGERETRERRRSGEWWRLRLLRRRGEMVAAARWWRWRIVLEGEADGLVRVSETAAGGGATVWGRRQAAMQSTRTPVRSSDAGEEERRQRHGERRGTTARWRVAGPVDPRRDTTTVDNEA